MGKRDSQARTGAKPDLTPAEIAALEEGFDAAPVPEPDVEVEAPVKPDVTALPDREPQLTAERMFVARKADPIVEAFLHVERLRPEGVRKMSRAGWLAELEAFKAAPRG